MPNISLLQEEQKSIVKFIISETRNLDFTISQLNREIEFLREYRTRLTADVVTGKLDVRDAAKSLPAESAETPSEANLSDSELESDFEVEDELEEVEG